MKPVDQTTFGYGTGNCFAACIASILETPIELVPSITIGESWDGYLKRLFCWLDELGLAYMEVEPSKLVNCDIKRWGYHLLCGRSPRLRDDGIPIEHAVVARSGTMIHDPHFTRDGLIPETPDNPYFVGIIVDKDPSMTMG